MRVGLFTLSTLDKAPNHALLTARCDAPRRTLRPGHWPAQRGQLSTLGTLAARAGGAGPAAAVAARQGRAGGPQPGVALRHRLRAGDHALVLRPVRLPGRAADRHLRGVLRTPGHAARADEG